MSEEKKIGIWRMPISWVALVAMLCVVFPISRILCSVGVWLVSLLSELSTVMVVVLLLIFGGTYIGIVLGGLSYLPTIIVYLDEMIYPSKHGVRYCVIGIWTALGAAACIFLLRIGVIIAGPSKIWWYGLYIWNLLFGIVVAVMGYICANSK